MNINENGSPRQLIIVHPKANRDGSKRPSKSFKEDQAALDYALEGDDMLYIFEDGMVYPMARGPKSGASWGQFVAEGYLYSGLELNKDELLKMCFHEDTEASKAFIEVLVDCFIEYRTEVEASL
ncbi:MAG: hypothetical protein ACK5NC_05325 [Vibrio sp.]